MLVSDPVFFKQLLHLLSDQVPVIWDGDEWNRLSRFGVRLALPAGDVVFGILSHRSVYTVSQLPHQRLSLFKRLQRGPLGERVSALVARDEVIRLAHRQNDPEIKSNAMRLTLRTRNGLHEVGNIGLCSLVELHVGVDRKRVVTLQTDPFAFTVTLQRSLVDPKVIAFADRAPDAA